ncbi:MAG: HU family DNA-binding protein [Ignavibacteriae bacterium]|nr:MAG: HU family DNA-binding protein [Ignavibacteriota bacterium]
MNKAELIEAIASGAGLSKTQADAALNATLTAIKTEMSKGNDVALIGFGSFKVGKRGARSGRNPFTGKTIKIAAKKVAKFSPGAELKAIVNGEKKVGAKKAAPKTAKKAAPKAATKKAAAKKKK